MKKILFALLLALLPFVILAQESPGEKYHRLEWEVDSAETIFYLHFWHSYGEMLRDKSMDSDLFRTLFAEWMEKIIERNNFVLENYEQIIPDVHWFEGVHILRVKELMPEENQKLAEHLRELRCH